MSSEKKSTVSLGDVARAAGVSTTSAGCALRNLPGVGEETRRKVLQVAKRLNYFPDARLASTMARIRQTAIKDLLPIIWMNANKEKDAWSRYNFLSPYMEGAKARLKELGYRIEEIWSKESGFSMRRTAQLIENRGVEGVILTDPAKHVRLNWDRVAGVAIGGALLAPPLHRVAMDSTYNLALALKMLSRLGYQRIGVCMTEQADNFSRHGASSTALFFNTTLPKARRVEPLFTPYFMKPENDAKMVADWVKKERPDAVVGHSSHLIHWVESAGRRVPDDVAVVHTAIEDDCLDWAGVYANKREIGRLAASKLVSLIQQRQFGLPAIASTELVPGVWRSGRTAARPRKP